MFHKMNRKTTFLSLERYWQSIMIPVLHQYPLVTLLLMFGQGPDQLEPTAGAGQSKTENVRL